MTHIEYVYKNANSEYLADRQPYMTLSFTTTSLELAKRTRKERHLKGFTSSQILVPNTGKVTNAKLEELNHA